VKYKINLAGEEQEIEVQQQGDVLLITRQGQTTPVRVVHADGAHFVLEYADGERRRRLRAAGHILDQTRRQLWVNGSNLTYERVREQSTASSPAGDAALSASIPAVVSEILVQVGDTVAAGERLILLESMKMILPIQAPYAGVVTAIHCETGEAVQPGRALVELEPEQ
jgi:biotin carboxyl carrier protein